MSVAEADKTRNLRNLNVPVSALYLLAREDTPVEVIAEVEERGRRGEKVTVTQVRTLTERAFGKASGEVRRITAEDWPSTPPERTPPQHVVSLVNPGVTTIDKPFDPAHGVALHLITAMEGYARFDPTMAVLARTATANGRDREAIRRVAEAIIAALDDDAGPVTLEKIERRRRSLMN